MLAESDFVLRRASRRPYRFAGGPGGGLSSPPFGAGPGQEALGPSFSSLPAVLWRAIVSEWLEPLKVLPSESGLPVVVAPRFRLP